MLQRTSYLEERVPANSPEQERGSQNLPAKVGSWWALLWMLKHMVILLTFSGSRRSENCELPVIVCAPLWQRDVPLSVVR